MIVDFLLHPFLPIEYSGHSWAVRAFLGTECMSRLVWIYSDISEADKTTIERFAIADPLSDMHSEKQFQRMMVKSYRDEHLWSIIT